MARHTEQAALVKRTYEPGMSVSLVATQEGVSASPLSRCTSRANGRNR